MNPSKSSQSDSFTGNKVDLQGSRKRLFTSFILLMIFTMVIARFFVFIFPAVRNDIFGITMHHFFLGLILLLIAGILVIFYPISDKNYKISMITAIGLGLTIDESVFLILKEGSNTGYWEYSSLAGAIVVFILVSLYSGMLFLFTPYILVLSKQPQRPSQTNDWDDHYLKKHHRMIIVLFFFIMTLILSRIYVYLLPNKSFIMFSYEVHHLYLGLIILVIIEVYWVFCKNFTPLVLISKFFKKLNSKLKRFIQYRPLLGMGIGMGLIVDEFVFLLFGGRTNQDYWAAPSFLGMISLAFIICVFTTMLFLIQKNNILNNK